MTSDDCHVTVQQLFSKVCHFAETSKWNCLTISRRSRDLRRLSRNWLISDFHCFLFFVRTHPAYACACLSRYYYYYSFRQTGQHSAYFGHVTPPSGERQSWIFWYQMKDILREERIFDFGWKILTRWFPMRETNSQFLRLATYLLLQELLNPRNFDIVSKLVIGRREFSILAG